jgi:hypothetical protein
MRGFLLMVGILLAYPGYAEVYRWTDDNGQVHFSDRPHEGAEQIEIQDVQTFSAPPVRRSTGSATETENASESSFRYELLAITRPAQEEVLWNLEGQLDVAIQLSPGMQRGHNLKLYLDGQLVEGIRPGSTQAKISGVNRGVHNLRAAVVDRNGSNLIQSDTVTFSVQQTSVQNPNNPNVPRPTPLPGPRAR